MQSAKTLTSVGRVWELYAVRLSFAGLLVLLGCGPIQSTAMLQDAEAAMATARAADANTYAPYEWQKANEYRHQAKLEMGRSRYQVAVEYAQKAKVAAEKAEQTARTLNPPVVDESAP